VRAKEAVADTESLLCTFFVLFSVVIFGGTDLVTLGENLVASPTYRNLDWIVECPVAIIYMSPPKVHG